MMKTITVNGSQYEVINEVFGKCPKCGGETYAESDKVYADNPYDLEVCSSCGYWSNTVMNSDDCEEEFVPDLESMPIPVEISTEDEFIAKVEEIFNTQMEAGTDPSFAPEIMREAFNKVAYDMGATAKAINNFTILETQEFTIENYVYSAVIDGEICSVSLAGVGGYDEARC